VEGNRDDDGLAGDAAAATVRGRCSSWGTLQREDRGAIYRACGLTKDCERGLRFSGTNGEPRDNESVGSWFCEFFKKF
jgi:hypothetical protein